MEGSQNEKGSWKNYCCDIQIDRQMNSKMDGQTDRQIEGVEAQADRQIY
jgi:hypothetical protein